MKTYDVTIRWRWFKWQLVGVARCSIDLVSGLVTYFGPGAYITVKARNARA